ncbi:hypothetical protein [Niameybacter massiliensis]|uniref:hypothetical protein n=1 Tax=Niameybacter massiliensis TaxID=1658108 RepID=UPI0006B454A3|nr:hypothetical protein [Niameybacter massiliensis]
MDIEQLEILKNDGYKAIEKVTIPKKLQEELNALKEKANSITNTNEFYMVLDDIIAKQNQIDTDALVQMYILGSLNEYKRMSEMQLALKRAQL